MITLIILLLLLITYLTYKEDLDYFYDLVLYNQTNKHVDITNTLSDRKMKILILSTDDRDSEYIQLHKKSWEKYSSIHGYTFLFEKPCTNIPLYYCKYQRILQLMEQYSDYDYFLWVDSDTIVNKKYFSFPLESMIQQVGTEYNFIYTSFNMFKGFVPDVISSNAVKAFIGGFYMFKNRPEVKQLLQECINYIDYSKWKSLKKGNCSYGGPCYEEAAMFYNVRKNDSIKDVRITGNFLYNGSICYDDFFIIHDLIKSNDCFKKLS
jgi:hypothetical protein